MGLSTASTGALSAAPLELDRARAHRATQDKEVTTARLRARVLPPPARARAGVTVLSTASTVALLVVPLGIARVHHVIQGIRILDSLRVFSGR